MSGPSENSQENKVGGPYRPSNPQIPVIPVKQLYSHLKPTPQGAALFGKSPSSAEQAKEVASGSASGGLCCSDNLMDFSSSSNSKRTASDLDNSSDEEDRLKRAKGQAQSLPFIDGEEDSDDLLLTSRKAPAHTYTSTPMTKIYHVDRNDLPAGWIVNDDYETGISKYKYIDEQGDKRDALPEVEIWRDPKNPAKTPTIPAVKGVKISNPFSPLASTSGESNPSSNSNNNNNDREEEETITAPKKDKAAPGITIKCMPNFYQFSQNLYKKFPKKYTAKLSENGKQVTIKPVNEKAWEEIQAHLTEEKVLHHTHAHGRPGISYTIKGIQTETDLDWVKEELEARGLGVLHIHRGKNPQGLPKPVVYAILDNTPAAREASNIKYLGHWHVKIERTEPRGSPFCMRCSSPNHTANYCQEALKCGRCGGTDHHFKACTNEVKCFRCQGPHPANYKGCPQFPQAPARREGDQGQPLLRGLQQEVPKKRAVAEPKQKQRRPKASDFPDRLGQTGGTGAPPSGGRSYASAAGGSQSPQGPKGRTPPPAPSPGVEPSQGQGATSGADGQTGFIPERFMKAIMDQFIAYVARNFNTFLEQLFSSIPGNNTPVQSSP